MKLHELLKVDEAELNEVLKNPDSHYFVYKIPKRRKGYRTIAAPDEKLKKIQKQILYNVLYTTLPHPSSHAFMKGRSPVTNAKPHVGASIVLKLDIKDFFNNITYDSVYAFLYNYFTSTSVLADKCKKDQFVLMAELCSKLAKLMCFKGCVPQGAPTSPALTNLMLRRFDAIINKKIQQFVNQLPEHFYLQTEAGKITKIVYTRYADDLTFSIHGENIKLASTDKNIQKVLKYKFDKGYISDSSKYTFLFLKICKAVQMHLPSNLKINKEKISVISYRRRIRVTGVVVNEKLNVSKQKWRLLRAIMHNHLTGKRKLSKTQIKRLRGHIEWVRSVNPNRGQQLLATYNKLLTTT